MLWERKAQNLKMRKRATSVRVWSYTAEKWSTTAAMSEKARKAVTMFVAIICFMVDSWGLYTVCDGDSG